MPAAVQYDWSLFKNETAALLLTTPYSAKFVEIDESSLITNKQWMVDVRIEVGFVLGKGGPRHI